MPGKKLFQLGESGIKKLNKIISGFCKATQSQNMFVKFLLLVKLLVLEKLTVDVNIFYGIVMGSEQRNYLKHMKVQNFECTAYDKLVDIELNRVTVGNSLFQSLCVKFACEKCFEFY